MTNLRDSEILDAAADLIEPEGRWTQGEMARDKDGCEIPSRDEEAVCFCVMGALRAVTNRSKHISAESLFRFVVGGSIAEFNDAPNRTQAEVVAKLREAAAIARGEP